MPLESKNRLVFDRVKGSLAEGLVEKMTEFIEEKIEGLEMCNSACMFSHFRHLDARCLSLSHFEMYTLKLQVIYAYYVY